MKVKENINVLAKDEIKLIAKKTFELMNEFIISYCNLLSRKKEYEGLSIYSIQYMGNVNYEQEYYEVDVMHGSKLKIISIDDEYINCKLLETA